MMLDTVLTIRKDAPIGTISPRLYGHFAEHLGRCCYEGLWVGQGERNIPHQDGFRTDVMEALRALPVPMLRWPGGCYADHYHWRDGIGPQKERPIRLGMSCGLQVEDDNSLGTHEFLRFCELLGAEPYLAGNMGSGTPQELCDWLEYCNSSVRTTLARERAANGSPEPFGVRLWGVGNENWGCGGNYDAATYAREYRRYATMLRHVDPSAELVVCGFDDAWNATVLQTLGNHQRLADHLSIHDYWIHGGPETDFTEDDYYTLLAEASRTVDFVRRTAALIQDATGGKHRIGIALDEWGVWHPEAREFGPHGEVVSRSPVTYEQANTLRDALAAGIALEGFHRQCNVLSLANLAQIVNVLQSVVMTEGSQIWLTPTYHLLHMHRPHIGATALPIDVTQGSTLADGSSAVSATASHNDGRLAVTVINRHWNQPASVRIMGTDSAAQATGQLLSADSPHATNSLSHPDRVAPVAIPVSRDGQEYRIEIPPHSLATIML
jgi:alpha-N-arabinofuranosidase